MKRIVILAIILAATSMAFGQKKGKTLHSTPSTLHSIEHPWAGKRVAYIGDSITDPNTKASETPFWQLLQDWLGITPYVYGISGRQWDDVVPQAKRLQDEHGDDFDAIIIFMGTNDFNAGVPIGEWFTEKVERVEAATGEMKTMYPRRRRTPVMTRDTYCGRINIALSTLKAMYPTKQIVLLTPLHRGYANYGDRNVQPDESYQNQCGEYIDAYIKKVREAADIWAVPVIDWAALSGLQPLLPEHLQFFGNAEWDQLHPNGKGHTRLAKTLVYQLLTLPCTF